MTFKIAQTGQAVAHRTIAGRPGNTQRRHHRRHGLILLLLVGEAQC